jgi:Protein of unknown function (DUF1552)
MTGKASFGPARLTRRHLLRGLGAGTVLLAPFLKYRSAWAQPAQSGNLLIFYTPNGHLRAQFGAAGPDAGAGFNLLPSLAPLQEYQSDVTVIKGLCSKTPTNIDSHQDIVRILTQCNTPGGQKNETDATQFTAYGPSIDQSIGAAINQQPLVVAVDPYRDQPYWRTLLSWNAPMVNEPFVKDFTTIFASVFGGVAGTQSAAQMAAVLRAQQRNQSILDLVTGDIATFRARVSTADRIHLDTYLTSIRSVEQRIAVQSSGNACSLTSLQTRAAALGTPPIQSNDTSADGLVAQMTQFGQLHMDTIATAFGCGARRIAVIQWQGASEGYDVGANVGSPTHHSASHYQVPNAAMRLQAIDTWYATQFAYMMNALKAQNVLDTTIIVWVTEITEGHNTNNMVNVVAGGASLGMKLGQYIEYPFYGQEVEGAGAIPYAQDPRNHGLPDLWVSVQNAMGVPAKTFGDAQWSTGGLPELR